MQLAREREQLALTKNADEPTFSEPPTNVGSCPQALRTADQRGMPAASRPLWRSCVRPVASGPRRSRRVSAGLALSHSAKAFMW